MVRVTRQSQRQYATVGVPRPSALVGGGVVLEGCPPGARTFDVESCVANERPVTDELATGIARCVVYQTDVLVRTEVQNLVVLEDPVAFGRCGHCTNQFAAFVLVSPSRGDSRICHRGSPLCLL